MLHSIFRNRRIGYMGNALMFDSFADAYLFPSGLFHRVFYQQLRQKNYPIRQSQLYKFYTHLKKSVPLKDMGAYLDACSYLPDDVLCKVDRASMSYALEVRVPILDHRIMEFAASLPSEMKYTKSRGGKIVLKNLLEKYIPRDLWDRPKQGFGAPVKKWLRNELKTVMLDYLSPDMLKQETYLNNDFIQKRIQDHLSGTKDNASFLWNLLLWMMWNQNKKK